ncbi:MAG: ABC transporter ATP-binding protein [Planctomycetota bacterium]
MSQPLLQVRNLRKSYRMGETEVPVLRGVDVVVGRGEFLAIEGRSGSGKSTLLHLMGLLDDPDAGEVLFDGEPVPRSAKSGLRNTRIGFVFQFYHLLPELDVLQNTLLAAMVPHAGQPDRRTRRQRATELLELFGLQDRLSHRPAQLSGGERQRVAIARALMNEPELLLADEPTGNLDTETGEKIMEQIGRLHAERGQTLVMVTHDRALAKSADRDLVLQDGKLVE